MNFLSHYYVEIDDERPYYVMGLILPDLVKTYDRNWKITKKQIESHNSELSDIGEGILCHFEVDALFHNSVFFKEKTAFINELLKKYDLYILKKRGWFFSHIILELMLDRMLVKKFPTVGDQFYTILNKLEKPFIDLYLKKANFVEQDNDFFTFFDNFRAKKYIIRYSDNNSFIFALNKIFEKIIKDPLSEKDNDKLKICLQNIENDLSPDFHSIFEEIKITN